MNTYWLVWISWLIHLNTSIITWRSSPFNTYVWNLISKMSNQAIFTVKCGRNFCLVPAHWMLSAFLLSFLSLKSTFSHKNGLEIMAAQRSCKAFVFIILWALTHICWMSFGMKWIESPPFWRYFLAVDSRKGGHFSAFLTTMLLTHFVTIKYTPLKLWIDFFSEYKVHLGVIFRISWRKKKEIYPSHKFNSFCTT